MKDLWAVVTEVTLIAQLESWHKDAKLELFAVQQLFREEGPDAFSLTAAAFTERTSWEELEEPCWLEFFVQIRGRFLRIELEIRPGRTVVFRRARRI
jgi:hypothetical protein